MEILAHPRVAAGVGDNASKRICASCPVRRQCADYAIAADERYGVWGGLTAAERARQVRRRAVA